jgi:hypothetical protein
MAGYRQWGVARAPAGPPRGGRAVLPRTQDALPQGACGHESQWTWALVGALVTDLHFELWIGDAPAVRAKRVGSKKPIASTPQCAETYFTAPGAAALATHGVIRPLAGPRKNWRPTRAYPLIARLVTSVGANRVDALSLCPYGETAETFFAPAAQTPSRAE